MITLNLVVALALIVGPWAGIARALAVSERHRTDLAHTAPARLAAKTVPWRSPPDNRVLPELPQAGRG
jgi:hypothetical protein